MDLGGHQRFESRMDRPVPGEAVLPLEGCSDDQDIEVPRTTGGPSVSTVASAVVLDLQVGGGESSPEKLFDPLDPVHRIGATTIALPPLCLHPDVESRGPALFASRRRVSSTRAVFLSTIACPSPGAYSF